jgi:hypothetical protein
MRIDDLRIAFIGIMLIVVGVVIFLVDSYIEGWILGLVELVIFCSVFCIVPGIGLLYVAFSRRFKTEP